MHPRLSLHQVAFRNHTTSTFVEHCRDIGIAQMTVAASAVEQDDALAEARAALTPDGPRVDCLVHPFSTVLGGVETEDGQATRALLRVLDHAVTLGARAVYLVTGSRGNLSWEDAATCFASALAPCVEVARTRGILLLVETTTALNAHLHIAHSLEDTVKLARLAGIGVCVDLQAVWWESALAEKLDLALPLTGLVQVSDYVLGDRSAPCRAVPGDGSIPLRGMLSHLISGGYDGPFDLELIGPRIDHEGPSGATRRAAQYVTDLLSDLGA